MTRSTGCTLRFRLGSLLVVGLLGAGFCVLPVAAQTSDARFDVVCIAQRDAQDIAKRKACLGTIPVLSFGSEVTLAVEHAVETDFDEETEPDPARLVLFLEGKPLPGTRARVGKSQLNEDGTTTTLLTFRIVRDLSTETARKNWKDVIVAARARRILTVSTGLETGAPARTRAEAEFQIIEANRLVLWLFAALAIGGAFLWVAGRTGMLRDGEPPTEETMNPSSRTFSMARVQMAVWTVIVLLSFLYVWLLTREFNGVITSTALVVMGVATGTLASAAGVDSHKLKSNEESLEEEERKPDAAPEKVISLARQLRVTKSEGFFKDMLTSAEGPSLHRLQFLAWTMVLMAVFIVGVWETLTMPIFDDTLLALMGISSGAYVGLKVPEVKV